MKYDVYTVSVRELLLMLTKYVIFAGLVAILFFDSFVALLILLPGFVPFLRLEKRKLIKIRKKELALQFREMISSVAVSLRAGLSVENAFLEAIPEMGRLYGEESLIVRELRSMENKMSVGETIESILKEFSLRANEEDISDFVVIFSLAKRSGSDLAHIIERSVYILRSRQETEQEIEVVLSGKKYEQRIMSVIPLGIIAYLRLTQDSYLDPVYNSVSGMLLMGACLAIYFVAYLIGGKIVEIEV